MRIDYIITLMAYQCISDLKKQRGFILLLTIFAALLPFLP
jgi:hypothetical protein